MDRRIPGKRGARPRRGWLLLALLATATVSAARGDESPAPKRPSKLFDATDRWLDLSEFLDSALGFVPVVSPITEPAVGYGAGAALVFVDRRPPADGQTYARPNLAMLGGFATENGSRGLLAAHIGNFKAGRLRSVVGAADVEIHLEYFGLGGDRSTNDRAVEYVLDARGGVAGASYRFGSRPIWAGLQYANVRVRVDSTADPNLLPQADFDLDLAALVPALTFDTRDNFFTPTRGWYLDLSVPVFRQALGGDRDFVTASLTGMHFRPLAEKVFLGARARAQTSTDRTPFFLRPYVVLRGVQALRYQGELTAEMEAELRWQFHRRVSLVAFGGAGGAQSDRGDAARRKSVSAGGLGLRYLLARGHGLHMGIDLAVGPDEPILYVVFGSAWFRP
jgi:hypothetical protein